MTEHAAVAEQHESHVGTYIKIFIALAVLTAIEVAVPIYMRGTPDPRVALGLTADRLALLLLAAAKASLVGLYFMHLKWETTWLRFIAMMPAALTFFAIFLIAEAIYR